VIFFTAALAASSICLTLVAMSSSITFWIEVNFSGSLVSP
jgi:hypothetical protein